MSKRKALLGTLDGRLWLYIDENLNLELKIQDFDEGTAVFGFIDDDIPRFIEALTKLHKKQQRLIERDAEIEDQIRLESAIFTINDN